jgi:hypothetical protein
LSISPGRPYRASGDLAFYGLDAMHAFLEASETEWHVELTSTCDRPAPLPSTWLKEHTL